jgi:hypothetical protein
MLGVSCSILPSSLWRHGMLAAPISGGQCPAHILGIPLPIQLR